MWPPSFRWLFALCLQPNSSRVHRNTAGRPAEKLVLPPPFDPRSSPIRLEVIGWPKGKMPTPPAGFEVNLFAEDLDNPRTRPTSCRMATCWSSKRSGIPPRHAEKSAEPDHTFSRQQQGRQTRRPRGFIDNLNMPYGMAAARQSFLCRQHRRRSRLSLQSRPNQNHGKGEKILDLPRGGHYTRNVIADPDGKKLYITVGSATNVDEENDRRQRSAPRGHLAKANLDGSAMRVFASGLRNAVGMDWEPKSKQLWTVVNERDLLGDELVPDYLTSVKENAFYGWPYSYFGQNEDPRKKNQRPDLVAKTIKPDYALGSHIAPLGLAFLQRQGVYRTLSRRRIHRHARFMEQIEYGRLQSRLRAVSKRQTEPDHGRYPDRFPRRPKSKFEAYGRPVGVTVAPTARCSSPTTAPTKSGASAQRNSNKFCLQRAVA